MLRQAGFTLIEILIAITIIAILASIVVPQLVSSRASANDSAIVAELRMIASSEFKFKAMRLVDTDLNGGYEYGMLGEMAGVTTLRGTSERMDPNLLHLPVNAIDDTTGRFKRHGFYIMVFLPNALGQGLAETSANAASISSQMAEDYWTAVAWPVKRGMTGRGAYFVNQGGEIFTCKTGPYEGETVPVPPGAAMRLGSVASPQHINSHEIAVNATGADGHRWMPVN